MLCFTNWIHDRNYHRDLLTLTPSLLIYSALKTLSTLAENNAAIIGLKARTIIAKKYLEWNAPPWILVVVRIMMALFLEQNFLFCLSWDPAGFSIYNQDSYSVVDCCKIQYFSCKNNLTYNYYICSIIIYHLYNTCRWWQYLLLFDNCWSDRSSSSLWQGCTCCWKRS